eukprot:scaffold80485_cov65-Phaeocystis_antarctica.AAC.6
MRVRSAASGRDSLAERGRGGGGRAGRTAPPAGRASGQPRGPAGWTCGQGGCAAQGAKDDHEALEDRDHVERLEVAQPDREHIKRDARASHRDRRKQVRRRPQEGVGAATLDLLDGPVIVAKAVGHLDHRLRGEHVARKAAAQCAQREAGGETALSQDDVGHRAAVQREDHIVDDGRWPAEERDVLCHGAVDVVVIAAQPHDHRADADQHGANQARGRQFFLQSVWCEEHVPHHDHAGARRDDRLRCEAVSRQVEHRVEHCGEKQAERIVAHLLCDHSVAEELLTNGTGQGGDHVQDDADPPELRRRDGGGKHRWELGSSAAEPPRGCASRLHHTRKAKFGTCKFE